MALPEEWQWVEELIQEEGRTLNLYHPGSAAVAGKAWRGKVDGTPVNMYGVFVRYKERQIDGDHVRIGDQKVLVIPSDTLDITSGFKVVDSLDTSSWNVVGVDKITSGSDILLYILQVRK